MRNLLSNKNPIWHTFECFRIRLKAGIAFVILILTIYSCAPAHIASISGEEQNANFPVSWFSTDTSQFLFTSSFDVLKRHFSGLMVIKNMGGDTFRVVLLSEIGLKVMDLEFQSYRNSRVHYIMEGMNKPVLTKSLNNIISMVLYVDTSKMKHISDKGASQELYISKSHRLKNYYKVKKDEKHPYFIRQKGTLFNKVKAEIYGSNTTGIDSIHISHYSINLNIHLNRLQPGHVKE